MVALEDNLYCQWRLDAGVVSIIRDNRDCPPERLLQGIWQQQRFIADKLLTLDGTAVRVLHPGFQNLEGGPDFKGAVLCFGDASPVMGDVEVDLQSSGWRAHRHHINPAFASVILHVVWEAERATPGTPATLPVRHALDSPIGELSLWLSTEAARALPEPMQGRCATFLRAWSDDTVLGVLREAAAVRLRSKAASLAARARQFGWEQTLWEGLFRALGYKNNAWPMQRIGELRSRWRHEAEGELVAVQARLLGISGLLPGEVLGSNDVKYLRTVWDVWWREREAFADCILPPGVWRLHGLRPANHPQRRLAAGSHWAVQEDLPANIERWCAKGIADSKGRSPNRRAEESLMQLLTVPEDRFWSWHWRIGSPRLQKAQPLVGPGRVSDVAVNVILPWLWARAVEGKNAEVQAEVERRYYEWPAAEDNGVLRQARRRMLAAKPANENEIPKFKGHGREVWKNGGAAAQQGLMQIVRDFCDQSNAVCEGCRLPEYLKAAHTHHCEQRVNG